MLGISPASIFVTFMSPPGYTPRCVPATIMCLMLSLGCSDSTTVEISDPVSVRLVECIR